MDVYAALGPLLRRLEPERAHRLTLWGLRAGLAPRQRHEDAPALAQILWGRRFSNPIGLAAGFDKDAVAIAPLLALGFGLVEVGSITPRPQPGNPRPRIFRLPEDKAVINRLGFNSRGLDVAAANLRVFRSGRRGDGAGIVGVNLGKNRDSEDAAADYEAGVLALARYADYITINVSSPNTPGLRALQGREELERLLTRVRVALAQAVPDAPPPVLLKISPDLTPQDRADVAAVALDQGLNGLIVSNTTISRPPGLRGRHRNETGGLSGRPLFKPSTDTLRDMYRLTEGRIPLIGVGGVASGEDAYAKIRAGASLIQLYTALIFQGPGLIQRIKSELAACLERDGYGHIADAVGSRA